MDPVLARDTGRRVFRPSDAARRDVRSTVPGVAHVGGAVAIGVRSMFAGTYVETVRGDDIAALYERRISPWWSAERVQSARSGTSRSAGAPGPLPGKPTRSHQLLNCWRASVTCTAFRVVNPGSDGRAGELPERWKGQPSRVDSAGDLMVEAGPDRDTVVIVAHLDELASTSWESTTHVATLAPLGGFYPSLWEGEPALLLSPRCQQSVVNLGPRLRPSAVRSRR